MTISCDSLDAVLEMVVRRELVVALELGATHVADVVEQLIAALEALVTPQRERVHVALPTAANMGTAVVLVCNQRRLVFGN